MLWDKFHYLHIFYAWFRIQNQKKKLRWEILQNVDIAYSNECVMYILPLYINSMSMITFSFLLNLASHWNIF